MIIESDEYCDYIKFLFVNLTFFLLSKTITKLMLLDKKKVFTIRKETVFLSSNSEREHDLDIMLMNDIQKNKLTTVKSILTDNEKVKNLYFDQNEDIFLHSESNMI